MSLVIKDLVYEENIGSGFGKVKIRGIVNREDLKQKRNVKGSEKWLRLDEYYLGDRDVPVIYVETGSFSINKHDDEDVLSMYLFDESYEIIYGLNKLGVTDNVSKNIIVEVLIDNTIEDIYKNYFLNTYDTLLLALSDLKELKYYFSNEYNVSKNILNELLLNDSYVLSRVKVVESGTPLIKNIHKIGGKEVSKVTKDELLNYIMSKFSEELTNTEYDLSMARKNTYELIKSEFTETDVDDLPNKIRERYFK